MVSELMTDALLHGSLRGRLIRVRVTLGHRVRGERPHEQQSASRSCVNAGPAAAVTARVAHLHPQDSDSDTDRRDRVDKPPAYAATGIPVYPLIDRDTCEVKVYSAPDGGRCETVRTVSFGKEVALPEPVGITLKTEPLKNWVR